ncbi:hypothetical protein [Bacillus stratosphericus]|uniref:hypothetical protein n=1 Tax=Bacillus stratosphericus TaxID=293386 RepID=UPI001CFB89FE|nr:hypothetical protein [Bacillus stratosphericus]
MISIKNVKDGGVAYIFGAEYTEIAKSLFPQFAQRLLDVEEKPSVSGGIELSDIRNRVEKALPTPRKADPTYNRLKGLSDEKAASELISILYEKIGKSDPVRLRPFYTEVESTLGVQFSRLHKQRLSAPKAQNGKYPHRKMDTILLHASREAVLEIAENYVFGG